MPTLIGKSLGVFRQKALMNSAALKREAFLSKSAIEQAVLHVNWLQACLAPSVPGRIGCIKSGHGTRSRQSRSELAPKEGLLSLGQSRNARVLPAACYWNDRTSISNTRVELGMMPQAGKPPAP